MRKIGFIFLVCLHTSAFAFGGVDTLVPGKAIPLSDKDRERILGRIKGSMCIYSGVGEELLIREWEPSVWAVSAPCPDKDAKEQKKQFRYLCISDIVCRSPTLTFAFESARCWARDSNHCPSPQECAEQSFVNSLRNFKSFEGLVPVYRDDEPVRAIK